MHIASRWIFLAIISGFLAFPVGGAIGFLTSNLSLSEIARYPIKAIILMVFGAAKTAFYAVKIVFGGNLDSNFNIYPWIIISGIVLFLLGEFIYLCFSYNKVSKFSMDKRYDVLMLIIISLIILPILFYHLHSGDIKITREVILKGDVGEPEAITGTVDGGIIIVGKTRGARHPWATKTDGQGNVLWTYRDTRQFNRFSIDGTEFVGVVPMPDGSSYLCGNMPESSLSISRAFLVHLTASGQELNDEVITSSHSEGSWLSFVQNCSPLGDGFVIISEEGGFFGLSPRKYKRFYWIIAFDSGGRQKWEKFIPAITGFGCSVSMSFLTIKGDILFSSVEGDKTEIFRLTENGAIEAHNILPGVYKIINSEINESNFKLFGHKDCVVTSGRPLLTNINNKLEEIGHIEGYYPNRFGEVAIYQMADRSFTMFGEGIDVTPSQFSSRVAHVSPTLQKESYVNLDDVKYEDFGIIGAVTAIDANKFVVSRKIFHNDPQLGFVGISLDFIHIN